MKHEISQEQYSAIMADLRDIKAAQKANEALMVELIKIIREQNGEVNARISFQRRVKP